MHRKPLIPIVCLVSLLSGVVSVLAQRAPATPPPGAGAPARGAATAVVAPTSAPTTRSAVTPPPAVAPATRPLAAPTSGPVPLILPQGAVPLPVLAPTTAPAPASQPALAAAPATAPTSAPAPHKLIVPDGFKIITDDVHTILLEPADEAWVRQALKNLKPTTVPSTQPNDMLGQVQIKKEPLAAQVTRDLALTDKADVEKFVTHILEPMLKKMSDIKPNLVYVVTTRPRLSELKKAGWREVSGQEWEKINERFYYNRAKDDVDLNPDIDIASPDDLIVPALYEKDSTPERKVELLHQSIHDFESKIMEELSGRAAVELHRGMRAYVASHIPPNIAGHEDQQWFIIGVANTLAAQYLAMLTGAAEEPILKEATSDHPFNRVRSGPINLLQPASANELLPNAVPLYIDALSQKATRAFYAWLSKSPKDSLPKLLTEMRKNPPPDGMTLLRQMKDAGGVDITAETQPQ